MSDESSDSEEEEEEKADAKGGNLCAWLAETLNFAFEYYGMIFTAIWCPPGVDQDEGLSKMLDSDESSDEDKDKDKDKDDEDDEDETGKKKKKKSSSRGNSDDEEEGKGKKKGSTNNSRSSIFQMMIILTASCCQLLWFTLFQKWFWRWRISIQVRHPHEGRGESGQGREEKGDGEIVKKRFPEKEFRILLQVANLLDPNAEAPAKKSRLEQFGNAAPGAMQGNEAISEEAVRRWRYSPFLPSRCLRFQTTKISLTPSHVLVAQVFEEKADDHDRLAEEVPLQENGNSERTACPTSGQHLEEDKPSQTQGSNHDLHLSGIIVTYAHFQVKGVTYLSLKEEK